MRVGPRTGLPLIRSDKLCYQPRARYGTVLRSTGSMLPSEEQRVNEWGMSRTTAIRALQILNRDGWIDPRQGKGHFVRGRPATSDHRLRPSCGVLEQDEQNGSRLVEVGHVIAPDIVAAALNLKKNETVLR